MAEKKIRCRDCEFCKVVKKPDDPPPPSWWITDWFPLWECSKGHTKERHPVYQEGGTGYKDSGHLSRPRACPQFVSMG